MNKIDAINFLIQFIDILRKLIVYALIGRVLLSWFTMGMGRPGGRFGAFLFEVTDPFINFVRKFPHSIGMIDFSAMIAILGVDLLGKLFIELIIRII